MNNSTTSSAQVVRTSFLSMQVCIPNEWTDSEIIYFAEKENPCGTTNGWFIRTEKKLLENDPSRNPCSEIKGFVHVMLDA